MIKRLEGFLIQSAIAVIKRMAKKQVFYKMGTTSEIKETNIGQGLINKTCERCNKKFTDKDILEEIN